MNKIQNYCNKIKEAAIKNDCWTCECLQGFIAQLLIDLKDEDIPELEKLIKDTSLLHSCLGCDPCPPGALFTEYLKNKKLLTPPPPSRG
jgi:hypothetical protein